MRDHRDIDRRSRAFGEAIAARLQERPQLVSIARANLARWRLTASVLPALDQWSAAVEGPFEKRLELLTSPDERATQLRQSNPFGEVLTEAQRNRILREFAAHEAQRA